MLFSASSCGVVSISARLSYDHCLANRDGARTVGVAVCFRIGMLFAAMKQRIFICMYTCEGLFAVWDNPEDKVLNLFPLAKSVYTRLLTRVLPISAMGRSLNYHIDTNIQQYFFAGHCKCSVRGYARCWRKTFWFCDTD